MLVLALLLLVAVAIVLGFYAQANQGTHDIALFGSTWHTWDWVPAAIAAGAVAVVCLAVMGYAAMRIASLRRTNARLREDVAVLRQERAAVAAPVDERAVVGRPLATPARVENVPARMETAPAGGALASRRGETVPVAEPVVERDGVPAEFARTPVSPPVERTTP